MTGGEEEEELLGVVHVIDLLQQQLHGEPLNLRALVRQPLVFRKRCRCSPRWSSSATRAPTSRLSLMSLVLWKGW